MLFSNRGIAFRNTGLIEEAINSFNLAIEINPDFAAAYYNRGLALHQKREYEAAVRTTTRPSRLFRTTRRRTATAA
jgi:tetratricopeptide (TPR) repeat protein